MNRSLILLSLFAATGYTGATGDTGKTGGSTTVIVMPPAASAPTN